MKKINPSILIFSLGMALVTATQLRIGKSPIGLGEITLSLWSLVTIYHIALNYKKIYITQLTKYFVTFWSVYFILLGLGSFVSLNLNILPNSAYRDAFAYIFVTISILLFSIRHRTLQDVKSSIAYIVSFTAIPLIFLYIYSYFSPTLGSIQLWYELVRFEGWASNPNQTALTSLITIILASYMCLTEHSPLRKIWYGILGIGMLLVGIESSSDSFVVGTSCGVFLILIIYWLRTIKQPSHTYWKGALTKIILPTILLLSILLSWPILFGEIQSYTDFLFNEGNQGEYRLILWQNGWQAFQQSPIWGFGPGAYSGFVAPFNEAESHNTLIDIGTNVGMIGMSVYVLFLLGAAMSAKKTKRYELLVGLVSVTIFGLLNFILRFPLFWYLIFITYAMALLQSPSRYEWKGEDVEKK